MELEFHVSTQVHGSQVSWKEFKWNSSSMNLSSLHGTQVPKKKKKGSQKKNFLSSRSL